MRIHTIAFAALAAMAGTGVAQARDQVQIAGSSTVLPFANIVAEQFGKANPKFKTPVVESGGSSAGLKNFCAGIGEKTIDVANSSRKIRPAEIADCKKNGVADIIEACRRFPVRKRERITFEYVLLAGVNDSPEDARRLAKLLSGVKAKVNLIPLNAAAGIPFERPSDDAVDRFARILSERDVTVSVRKSRGRDIRAACGQLIVEGQQRSTGQRLAALAFK